MVLANGVKSLGNMHCSELALTLNPAQVEHKRIIKSLRLSRSMTGQGLQSHCFGKPIASSICPVCGSNIRGSPIVDLPDQGVCWNEDANNRGVVGCGTSVVLWRAMKFNTTGLDTRFTKLSISIEGLCRD